MKNGTRVIDVHHHILPPYYRVILEDLGVYLVAPGRPLPKWSPNDSLSLMDEMGVDVAIVSIPGRGIYLQNDAFACDLARRCNEYSATLNSDYPNRFGAFASLPFPDIDGSLKEMEYSLDTLKLDGVVPLTNVKGRYLGAQEFEELYRELNRRKAVVFIQPTEPPCGNIANVKAPVSIIEEPLETTRTIGNLIYGGVFELYPDIRFIFAHGGGAIPYLAWRYSSRYGQIVNSERGPEYVIELLQRHYYETAMSASPYSLMSLQALAGSSHIIFGSDSPFSPQARGMLGQLRDYEGFNETDRTAVENGNAISLFPRLM